MMSQPLSTASEALQMNEAKRARTASWERLGILYVRIALGSAFLSLPSPTVLVSGASTQAGEISPTLRATWLK